jgi:hypothetical protein
VLEVIADYGGGTDSRRMPKLLGQYPVTLALFAAVPKK